MSVLHSSIGILRGLYQRLFRPQEDARVREALETIERVPLFMPFTGGILRDLAAAVHLRAYKPEEVIYYEQDPGIGLYVVERGRVRLSVDDESGSTHELRQVGEEDFFGECALLGDFRRMETARAITETRVLGFFQPDFKMLAKRNPAAGIAVMTSIARHLATRQEVILSRLAASRGKVAALNLLVERAAANGMNTAENRRALWGE